MENTKKNGTIELFRMLFCVIILFHHVSIDLFGREVLSGNGGLFRFGGLGVEFFFITSGYLMARSVKKNINSPSYLTKTFDVWKFIWKKVKPIIPYHIVFNVIILAAAMFINHREISVVLNRASSLLFLPTIGFNNHEWNMGSEWYIGYMLFVMAIVYPVLKRWFDIFSRYFSPILSIVLYGYLASNYGTVMESNRMVRAFAGILLGIFTYFVTSWLSQKKYNHWISFLIISYQIIAIIGVICYMQFGINRSIQPIIVLILWSSLIIMYSEKGIISKSGLANNKFSYWLGSISLPVYLIQNVIRDIAKKYLSNIVISNYGRVVLVVLLIIIGGIIAYYLNLVIQTIIKKE